MNNYEKEIINLEKRYKTIKNFDLKRLVNFNNYKNIPFQNWCNYQEGFSTNILDWFVDYLEIKNNITFLDPFCGSGSSLVTAKKYNFKIFGIDINPFSCLLSKIKIDFYTDDELKKIKEFKLPNYHEREDFYKNYEFSMIEKLFSKNNFYKIELLKNKINKIKSSKIKDFLFLSLICCLEICSNYKKAGNGLKKRKIVINLDIFTEFQKKKDQMLDDIRSLRSKSSFKIYNSNVSNLDKLIKNNSIDLSLFSPPYPNCFDYFEVYKIEMWLGGFVNSYNELKKYRKSAITSNLNANLKKDIDLNKICTKSKLLSLTLDKLNSVNLWNKNIPNMLAIYFHEMGEFLNNLYKKMKNGGNVGVVIGNSAYGGFPILSDLILSELAEKSGFNVKQVIVTRNNETASQQYKKITNLISYIRESIIVIQK